MADQNSFPSKAMQYIVGTAPVAPVAAVAAQTEGAKNAISTAFNAIEFLLIAMTTLLILGIGLCSLTDYMKAVKQWRQQDKTMNKEDGSLMIKDLFEAKLAAFYSQPGMPKKEPLKIYVTKRLSKVTGDLLRTYIIILAVHFAIPMMFSLLLLAAQDKFIKSQPLFMKNNRPDIKVQAPLLLVSVVGFILIEVFFAGKFRVNPKSREDLQDMEKLQARFIFIQGQRDALERDLKENISPNGAFHGALVNYLTVGEEDRFFRYLLAEQNPLERIKCFVSYSLLRTYRQQMPHYRPEEYDMVESAFREGIEKKGIDLLPYFMVKSPVIADASEELLKDILDFKRKVGMSDTSAAFEKLETDMDIRAQSSAFILEFNRRLSKLVSMDYPTLRRPVKKYLLMNGVIHTALPCLAAAATAVIYRGWK